MKVDVQTWKWGCEQKCFRNTGSEASPKMTSWDWAGCSSAESTVGFSASRALLLSGAHTCELLASLAESFLLI